VGHPVGRSVIIRKAQEVALLGCGRSIGGGWYRRFMERFPELTGRFAQALPLKRNFVVSSDLSTLFNTLAKLVIEHKLDSSWVFNMDVTAFQKQLKSKRVIAARGSSNVWTTVHTANFHLSIVACGSAAGLVVPPVFVLPGKTVSLSLLEGCEVQGAAVTTSESGFMNAALFEEWMSFFAGSIPTNVRRPLLLILDGCGSHYSPRIVDAAERLQILLVFLPPNATHLLQPLDVAVFATLKDRICKQIAGLVEEDDDGGFSISKDDAIALASLAWRGSKVGRNIRRRFTACGLFPLVLVKMNARLTNFSRNGVPTNMQQATWLHMQPLVEESILTLPNPPTKATSKRKRVTVGGRLLTHKVLQEIKRVLQPGLQARDTRSQRRRRLVLKPLT
jgi:hypothetical protein